MERVRAGEDRAFELLFLRYQPRIAAYVRGMVQDHGRAEDITQEVFMSALRRMRETDREIVFKPWIYEIAKNACIDAFRRGRNASEVSFDARDAIGADEHGRLAEPGATPDAAVEGKVAFDNLCGAFGGLSPVHHDILVLREFEGLSYSEIGERLGMSRPAVESTLFRARKRLTEEYEELVSGERCLRVQRIVDASGSRAAGLRDRRRLARHLSHCQPCRRYARLAGMDLGDAVRMRPVAAAVRIAAFMPLPPFLRRRWSEDEVAPLFAHHAGGPVTQWSASAATTVDPSVVSGWTKAVATAATLAVAGVGAGAAITERTRVEPAARPPLTQA
ncbi:MAG: RNA polymerase sigma factor, partial [Solirubrobacteraceae bacterium]